MYVPLQLLPPPKAHVVLALKALVPFRLSAEWQRVSKGQCNTKMNRSKENPSTRRMGRKND